MRALLVVVVVSALAARARADNLVIESYTQVRPASAPQALAPLIDELSLRGYVMGDVLGRRFESRGSRPARSTDGLTATFEADIERGHRLWVAGEFDDAVRALVPAIASARANSVAISQNQLQREKLLKGLTALALAHFRKGDHASAKDVLREILRSFPNADIARGIYGADAHNLFLEVRREAGTGGRGRLLVRVPSDHAVVFINEQFANVGNVTRGDVIPGDYRVYLQIGAQTSRVYQVRVTADHDATLVIDPAFDAALRTTGGFVGFVFGTAADRERSEADYAARFARHLRASAVVVVGIDLVRGRPSIIGALVDLQSGRELRRASVAIDPPPAPERLKTLARFLTGEESVQGLEVEIGSSPVEDAEDQRPARAPGSRRWLRWLGVGALGLGAAGGGLAVKFVLDSRGAGEELERVCAVTCTSEEFQTLNDRQRRANRNAIIAGAAGGLAITGGVVLLVLARARSEPTPVAVSVSEDGAFVHVGGEF